MTIFLIPESGSNLIKYLSRAFFLLTFVLYAARHGMHMDTVYGVWAFMLSVIFSANLLFAQERRVAMNTWLLVIQAIWIAFLIGVWLKQSHGYAFLFHLILLLSLFYCLRLVRYIGTISWGSRKFSTMLGTNVNSIGLRLSIAALLSLYLYYNTDHGLWKKAYLACMVIFIAFILVTGSRKALLMAGIAFAFFSLKHAKNLKKKLKAILIVAVGLVIVYVLLVSIPQLYQIIGRRLQNLVASALKKSSSSLSGADSDRIEMIRKGFEMFLERPFFGWGMGGFRLVSGIDHAYSHNNVIELLSATGIFGCVVYYLIFFYLGWSIWKNGKMNDEMILCFLFLVFSVISDMLAANYTSLVAHWMLMIPLCMVSDDTFLKKELSRNDGKGICRV